MKKFFYFSALVCTAIAFTACSSSKESAYRKAYEKAKAQEQQQYAQSTAATAGISGTSTATGTCYPNGTAACSADNNCYGQHSCTQREC